MSFSICLHSAGESGEEHHPKVRDLDMTFFTPESLFVELPVRSLVDK
jgi:hypothetical protein